MEVPAGKIFGFLGPNGAGKTTTIRILLGLLRASSGEARVFDLDAWRDGTRIRAEIGYLPGDVRFYDRMSGRAMLGFIDEARGGQCGGEIARLARVFDLELDKRIRDYSRGMKQKLGLIAALMHAPRLLILDEPTTALDPLVRESLNAELRTAAADGRTVVFSSHTLSEVEQLCDEVAILRGGELVERNRIGVLREKAVRHVEVRFDPQRPPGPLEGLSVLANADGLIKGAYAGPIDRLLAWLSNCGPRDVSIAPPDLEDLFRSYYGEAKK